MTSSENHHTGEHHDERDEGQAPPGDDRQQESKRPDPDAPGNYVDDETSAEVPEPNEPG